MKHAWEKFLKKRGYKLRCTIGEGAYSKVKLAYSYNLKKNVAIKCVNFRDAPTEFITRFLPRELNTLTVMSHKNIIHVYEVIERYDKDKKTSFVCIVMEYAHGGDMLRYIQHNGSLPEDEVKTYFYQLCQAVKYCHSKGICHRDLKCENLLLGRDKKLILSDFGFCKFVNQDYNGNIEPSLTYCGSAAYAAPETLQGKPYDPFMHDVWSLGVILYILSSGQMPFDDTDVIKMVKTQNQDHINFLINLRCGHSKLLKNLLRLLLQVDVRKRGSVRDALAHPFLNQSRDLINKKISPSQGVLSEMKSRPFHKAEKKLKNLSKAVLASRKNKLAFISNPTKKYRCGAKQGNRHSQLLRRNQGVKSQTKSRPVSKPRRKLPQSIRKKATVGTTAIAGKC